MVFSSIRFARRTLWLIIPAVAIWGPFLFVFLNHAFEQLRKKDQTIHIILPESNNLLGV